MIKSLPKHVEASETKVLEVKCHPAVREAGLLNYSRPLKILTESEDHRTMVMDCISKYSKISLPRCSYAGRDLKGSELKDDYSLR